MVDKSRIVPPGELSAYERWELPNLGRPGGAPASPKVTKEKIKPLTAQDIEKIRQQAYDAGFEEGRQAGVESGHMEGLESGKEEGLQAGLSQGLANGQAKIDEQLTQLRILLTQLGEPLAQQQSQVEEAMLNVTMAVSRAVIHRELTQNPSTIKAALPHVLKDLPKADIGVVLRLNAVDEPVVQKILEDIESKIELQVDATITPGGCILKTSNQLVDYTIEKRYQKVVQSMLSKVSKSNVNSGAVEVPASIASLSDYSADTLDESDCLEAEEVDQCASQLESQHDDEGLPLEETGEEGNSSGSSDANEPEQVDLTLDSDKSSDHE